MEKKEIALIFFAIFLSTIVFGFKQIIEGDYNNLIQISFFSTIIILTSVFSKKAMASLLDIRVRHSIWSFSRYGLKPHQRLKEPFPIGAVLPLVLSLISLGFIKIPTFLIYETNALKRRAAKRHGYYSYTEISDWHNSIIGASGIFSVLLIAVIAYFLPFDVELLFKFASYYAIANMIPISNLDGAQIFFGSRVLYATTATFSLIFLIISIFIL